jgi:iron complex outermembrane recepter protein
MISTRMLLATTALALLVPETPLFAQIVDPGDIIVTARRRQESILKVPVVQNVLSADTLVKSQITDLTGVTMKVPGLFVSPGVNTIGTLISLRGIGTSSLDAGIDQSISLNIDGQQFSQGLVFKSGMFDLAQAEVLKGPQALFFGKNSPGGVIALTTADPGDSVEVIARASYEFEAREPRTELILSGPVSDTLGLRLAGSWSDRKGYFKNTAGATIPANLGTLAPAKSRADSNENYIIRGTAVWKPTDDFKMRLKLNLTRDKSDAPNGIQPYSCLSGTGPSIIGVPFIGGSTPCRLDDEVEISSFDPASNPGVPNGGHPFIIIRQRFAMLDLSYDVAPDVNVSSTTTYYRNVTDGMINGTYAGAAAALWADNDFYRRDVTQEIRIQSDYGDGPINWLAGGYYQDARMKNDIVIGWNQAINGPLQAFTAPILGGTGLALPPILDAGTHNVSIESKSLFGQLRFKPVDTVEIAGGVRYTDEERGNKPTRFGAPVTIPVPKIRSKNWSPELTITYTPTNDFTIFGALKQGYKSGSYQITTPNPANEDRSFGDEKIRGGEAGIKARLLERTLNVNAAFYYYRLNGLQVGVSEPAGAGGVPITRTLNAGKSRTYGVDFDATYRPPSLDGVSFNLAANWNKAEFIDLDGVPCYGGQTIALGCNLAQNPQTGLFTARSETGTALERAPEWQIIGGFDYEGTLSETLGFSLGSQLQYSSSWISPIGSRPDFRQQGFTKINAYVTVKGADDRWELSLIGNNITDKVRCGYGANSDFKNTTVLTAFAGVTGAPTNPSGKVDEASCIANAGRQVFVKLTLRPMGLFK